MVWVCRTGDRRGLTFLSVFVHWGEARTTKGKFGFWYAAVCCVSYVRIQGSLTLNEDSEEGMTLSLSDPRNHWMVSLWEDYCAKFSVCSPAEIDVDEVDLLRNSMMEEWQSYASAFGIAAPEDQLRSRQMGW